MLNVLTVLTFPVTICWFIADTKVHFVSGIEQEQEEELWDWHSVAELAKQETIATQAAGADRKSGQRSGPINTIATDWINLSYSNEMKFYIVNKAVLESFRIENYWIEIHKYIYTSTCGLRFFKFVPIEIGHIFLLYTLFIIFKLIGIS